MILVLTSLMNKVVLNCFQYGIDEVASFDFPSFLLGDHADAWPAIFPGTEDILDTVDISSLISSFFLSCLFT